MTPDEARAAWVEALALEMFARGEHAFPPGCLSENVAGFASKVAAEWVEQAMRETRYELFGRIQCGWQLGDEDGPLPWARAREGIQERRARDWPS